MEENKIYFLHSQRLMVKTLTKRWVVINNNWIFVSSVHNETFKMSEQQIRILSCMSLGWFFTESIFSGKISSLDEAGVVLPSGELVSGNTVVSMPSKIFLSVFPSSIRGINSFSPKTGNSVWTFVQQNQIFEVSFIFLQETS